MMAIEPDMVLGKAAIGGDGERLGEVVDVGLFSHSRVKFLVVEDKTKRVPIGGGPQADDEKPRAAERGVLRTIAADRIDSVSSDNVHVR